VCSSDLESGLKPDAAQKLVEIHASVLASAQAKATAAFEAQQKAWVSEVTADKELGGANLEASTKIAQRAVERFGSPAIKQLLNESGLGNHPELVRMFHRIGKAVAEDRVSGTTASQSGTAKPTQEALLRQQFPSMFPKE
jgi:hypothetical protein